MGAKCCTDRKAGDKTEGFDQAAVPKLSGADGADGSREKRQTHMNAFSPDKKRTISIGYHSKGDDAEKFDKAFETGDLKGFVALLSSNQSIEEFEENMHPWAADPKTVGALAGTQLAILASVSVKDNPAIKKDICEAGALGPLVDFLKSDQVDRVQTSAVALSFLSADCPSNALELYRLKVLPLLMPHLKSSTGGMRAAAATTVRNMCIESADCKKEFIELGGIEAIVAQLTFDPDPALTHADVCLENVLNIQDIVEDENGDPIKEYTDMAVRAGAVPALRKLTTDEDKEVRECAAELLEVLEKA